MSDWNRCCRKKKQKNTYVTSKDDDVEDMGKLQIHTVYIKTDIVKDMI